MKSPAVIIMIFFCCLSPHDLGAQDDPNVDAALNVLIQKAQREAQRDVIRLAARPMFNNVNDWQRWGNQLDAMQPQQLNGLLNILNAQQRQLLAQRQLWLSQLLHRQWLEQQLWLQQNALASIPFGMVPWGLVRPQLYYAPIVQWFPQGVHFNAAAVVSPDRRHVRMSLNPIFSSIGPIYHYNLRNGAYYPTPAYGQPRRYNQTGVTQTNRGGSFPRPAGNTNRSLPDWYKRIRNNP